MADFITYAIAPLSDKTCQNIQHMSYRKRKDRRIPLVSRVCYEFIQKTQMGLTYSIRKDQSST